MKVVVVGGGFGGVKAALECARRGCEDITLISESDVFTHHGVLYRTATGHDPSQSAIPLRDIVRRYPAVRLVHDTVRSIDAEHHTVQSKEKQYSYDALILALGLVDRFSGTNVRKQHSYAASHLDSARAFWEDFHGSLTEQAGAKLDVAIIGGGMAGVELAGALSECTKRIVRKHQLKGARVTVSLVEAQDRLLPAQSATASRKVAKVLEKRGVKIILGHSIDRSSKTQLIVGETILPVDMTVWMLGGKNHPLFGKHSDIFKLSPRGRVIVNQYMSAYPNVYVIGDNAETNDSGLASTAIRDAKFVARHLKRQAAERLPRPRRMGRRICTSIPVTQGWAYVEYAGVYAAGRTGALIRRLIELCSYGHFIPLREAYAVWRAHRKNVQICPHCQKS